MPEVNEDWLFSCVSGYNIYIPKDGDPSTVTHMMSGEEVVVREIEGLDGDSIRDKWTHFIQHPVDIGDFLWPVDAVMLTNGKYGLVFRNRELPAMTPLKKILYNPDVLYWQNPLIKKLVRNLLVAFDNLFKNGYAYHAFDVEKMYYNESTGDVWIDFSMALSLNWNGQHIPAKEVKIEFLPPWIPLTEEDEIEMSYEDDFYSIAALLFRLLIGRMPYQGRFMDGHGDMMDYRRDNDINTHNQMFAYYHDHPLFIFDPMDKSNSIGAFSHEEKIIERWNDLPPDIRLMFEGVFGKKPWSSSQDKKTLYSAEQWLEALKVVEIICEEEAQ